VAATVLCSTLVQLETLKPPYRYDVRNVVEPDILVWLSLSTLHQCKKTRTTKLAPIASLSRFPKTMSMEYFCCCEAISLNNTAIALMERNLHYLSYETLKDALELIAEGDKQAIDSRVVEADHATVQGTGEAESSL
jgi:hypothetical protein